MVTPFAKIQLAAAKRAEASNKGKGKEPLNISDKLSPYCFVNSWNPWILWYPAAQCQAQDPATRVKGTTAKSAAKKPKAKAKPKAKSKAKSKASPKPNVSGGSQPEKKKYSDTKYGEAKKEFKKQYLSRIWW